MNPLNTEQLDRLRESITYSRRQLEPFRRYRTAAIKEYVGKNYSDDGALLPVPVNLLELAIGIYLRFLISKNPQVLVATKVLELKPKAHDLQEAINYLIRKIKLRKSLQECALQAFFGAGIMKVGLNHSSQVEIGGYLHDVGQPFADSVSEDDWVYDITAKSYEQVGYEGNRYRLPLEYARDSKLFKHTDKMRVSEFKAYNEDGSDKAGSIGRGTDGFPIEFRDHTELYDIWLPPGRKTQREGLIVTFDLEGDGPAFSVMEWDGPETGPFHKLGFNDVPDNIHPLPSVALLMDMHVTANKVFRKVSRQAERQKTILGVAGGAEEDGNRIVNANDGEAWRLDQPDKVKEFNFGGVDARSMAFMLQLRQEFSYFAGNLDAMGGLSPMTDTVGQDQMLMESASKRAQDMEDRFSQFTDGVIGSLAEYLWNDPLIQLPLTKRVPGVDWLEIPTVFSANNREGDFLDYNIQISPYSMRHKSPEMRLSMLERWINTVFLPNLPMLQQQGRTVDFGRLADLVSEYTNMPEFSEVIVSFEGGTGPQAIGEDAGMGKPSTTTRRYERINRPGSTRGGKDSAMIQHLLGAGVQGSEMAAIGRPTG